VVLLSTAKKYHVSSRVAAHASVRNLLCIFSMAISFFGATLTDISAKGMRRVQVVMKLKMFRVAVLFMMTYTAAGTLTVSAVCTFMGILICDVVFTTLLLGGYFTVIQFCEALIF